MPAQFCKQCGVPILELNERDLCAACLELKNNPDALSKRTNINGVPFKDMKQMSEDERIEFMACYIRANPTKKVCFIVEKSPEYHGKGDRYIEKLKKLVPAVKFKRSAGPVPKTETIQFSL